MKLVRVAITNFKSTNRGEIDRLDPITILFGPTNSGKTSFLEALYFQFHHQQLVEPKAYLEFLHSKADPQDATMSVETAWTATEHMPALDLHAGDSVVCETRVRFSLDDPQADDRIVINGHPEDNLDRSRAVLMQLRSVVKLSSSRRPGDSKHAYFVGQEETPEQRRQRFLIALHQLSLQGNNYELFLAQLQRMFPHLVYRSKSEDDIMSFFGTGFLGTAKLFAYLFDARYSVVLIDEPEIHFYPSLVRRFVKVLHDVVKTQGKQIILATHSTLFLQERHLGTFFHIAKSKHFQTTVRRIDQLSLLKGFDVLNAQPEAILQSDIVIYVEGPWDIGVLKAFIAKFPELDHTNLTVFHLGGGSMGNLNVDPLALKEHNPLSFVVIDSEKTRPEGKPDPSHREFLERCSAAKLYCLMLQRRCMESYFTPRALREVFGDRVPAAFKRNDPFKTLQAQGLRWYDKDMNRQVAEAMTREEILAAPDWKGFFDELLRVSGMLQ